MVKCVNCGFLSIWNSVDSKFTEAHKYFRENGCLQHGEKSLNICAPACFIQKENLEGQFYSDKSLAVIPTFEGKIKAICENARNCDGFTPWLQGFHPKEHQEMLDRKSERRWRIVEGLIFAVSGAIVAGLVALVSQWVAKPEAPIVNVSPPAVNITTPPINVTVQPPSPPKPDGKAEKK